MAIQALRICLEFRTKIPLNAEQTQAIVAIRDEMRSASIALGDQLLIAEAALEAAFRDRAIDQAKLSDLTLQAGALRAQLRAAHSGRAYPSDSAVDAPADPSLSGSARVCRQ